jgi:hypothetical protein
VLKILTFIRHNTIALIALFFALGGTSYAALNLPAGSVGTKQLRNHSVTPSKLDPGSIGGYIRYWAEIAADGNVVASRPHATIMGNGWSTVPGASGGVVTWHEPIPSTCVVLATAGTYSPPAPASGVYTRILPVHRGVPKTVLVSPATAESVDVLVICPQP